MAKGKNKKVVRKDQKRKKDKHPFAKKEWFYLISPNAVNKTQPIGWTCCKKPQGTERVQDFLKGRIAEMCYGDITETVADINKKIKIVIDEVQGKACATSFYGFDLTRDVIMEKLKKRQSLIDIYLDVKCSDGNVFRIFVMIVTKRGANQLKLNSYAKHSKIKIVRKKISSELLTYCSSKTSDEIAQEIVADMMNDKLEKLATTVIPNCKLQVYKVKTIKRGAIDMKTLLQGVKEQKTQEKAENPEAQNLLSRAS